MIAIAGCGEKDDTRVQTVTTEAQNPPPVAAPGDSAPEKPLYAVMYEIYDDIGSNSYLSLIDSLDVASVDPGTSREYPGGRAFMQVYGSWLFVGEPTAPIVTRYSIGADDRLIEEGSISFGNFGLESGTIDPWSLTFISPTKAYLFDEEGTHIIWNPTSLEITGEIVPPPEFGREGVTLQSSPAMVRGDRLFRSIFWVDFDTASYSTEHLLAIYDVASDALIETVSETRCPAPGNLAHADEAGNFYFSNWIWPIAGTLMRGAPAGCVLRINADSERFDPDWTLSFAELSGGLEGGMFSYLGSGKGLVSIFDDTKTTFDAKTDPWDYAGSSNWTLWNVDVAARTASPIEGIPPNPGAYTPAQLDGRSFVLVPREGWTSAQLYELRGSSAEPSIDIPGWSYALTKVR